MQVINALGLLLFINLIKGQQNGPDPWNYVISELSVKNNQDDVPPDLKLLPVRKASRDVAIPKNDWFYKRLLGILLKGGKVKKDDRGYVDITIQMQFPRDQWETLNEYLSSDDVFSEDMYRRSVGYVQDAILKPSVTEILVVAWKDYLQLYIVYIEQYKMHITWSLACLAGTLLTLYAWRNMSHRHVYMLIFAVVYLYEVFLSYKEAEQQEYEKFITSLNSCKWYFWSSTCNIPPLDPLVFIKHMHPLKIGMRIFTMVVSEPMLVITATVNTMMHEVTDGLWFPLNKISYGILIVIMNSLLIMFLLMILFNFILNIPFNLSFLSGLVNIGIKQREQNFTNVIKSNTIMDQGGGGDRLSGANLDKLINVFSHAITSNRPMPHHSKKNNQNSSLLNSMFGKNKLKSKKTLSKSASTGRLSDLVGNKQALVPRNKNVKKDLSRD